MGLTTHVIGQGIKRIDKNSSITEVKSVDIPDQTQGHPSLSHFAGFYVRDIADLEFGS